MATRVLQLNPDFPLVWRDPHTLQIGVDPPVVVMDNVQDDLLLLIHHLRSGLSPEGLAMFAKNQGVSPERTAELLTTLQPACDKPDVAAALDIVLDGPPDLISHATGVLRGLGHAPTRAEDSPEAPGEVLVMAHYVPHPTSFHRWLRRDQPHTPVVFADQSITVGPRITPGQTPCLRCALAIPGQSATHAAALASQLWGVRAASATPEGIRLATWHARDLIVESTGYLQLRLSLSTHRVQLLTSGPREGCGCLELALD
jgi:hypothetical protein